MEAYLIIKMTLVISPKNSNDTEYEDESVVRNLQLTLKQKGGNYR